MFPNDVTASEAAEVLDGYDFHNWVKLCLFFGVRDPYSIITHTNTWFDDPIMYEALMALTIHQFMEYLTTRYHVIFDEEPVRYRMREE